jgi:inositol phosphorylceramide mannosyltransferase catalytic subunit
MKRSAQTLLAFALRHRILIPAALIGIVLSYLFISHLLNFIRIFTPHSGIALEQADVIAAHEALAVQPDKRPQVVPKIIHQIFHNWKDPGNATLPGDWATERQTCLDLHPDWEFKVRGSP